MTSEEPPVKRTIVWIVMIGYPIPERVLDPPPTIGSGLRPDAIQWDLPQDVFASRDDAAAWVAELSAGNEYGERYKILGVPLQAATPVSV